MTWDPNKYEEFKDERRLPLLDLIKRIPDMSVGSIVDLGCGTGVGLPFLKKCWPKAEILGLDSASSMLKIAKKTTPGIVF